MRETHLPDFSSAYPAPVNEWIMHYHQLIMRHYPDIIMVIDSPAKMLAYGYGSRYKDFICTLIPSLKGLKIGFNEGARLPDPKGLLTGTGKVHKHIVVTPDLDEAYLLDMLKAAHIAYEKRK